MESESTVTPSRRAPGAPRRVPRAPRRAPGASWRAPPAPWCAPPAPRRGVSVRQLVVVRSPPQGEPPWCLDPRWDVPALWKSTLLLCPLFFSRPTAPLGGGKKCSYRVQSRVCVSGIVHNSPSGKGPGGPQTHGDPRAT